MICKLWVCCDLSGCGNCTRQNSFKQLSIVSGNHNNAWVAMELLHRARTMLHFCSEQSSSRGSRCWVLTVTNSDSRFPKRGILAGRTTNLKNVLEMRSVRICLLREKKMLVDDCRKSIQSWTKSSGKYLPNGNLFSGNLEDPKSYEVDRCIGPFSGNSSHKYSTSVGEMKRIRLLCCHSSSSTWTPNFRRHSLILSLLRFSFL